MKNPVPICGQSDKRNQEYLEKYTPEKYFTSLVRHKNPIILDIGAHQGESIRFFKEIFPNGIIYSFEPDPDNFKILEECCNSFDNFGGRSYCFNKAIADKQGTMRFYRQNISHLGGLLPINKMSKDSLGYASKAANEPIDVEVTTLDLFCSEMEVPNVDIMKIDVQGYEVNVLMGAIHMLTKTSCCTVEVSLYDFYEKSSSLLQVEQLMHDAGMKLWDISKLSKNPKNFRTDWVELVYINGTMIID
jgi:FkbM family methyltransferase